MIEDRPYGELIDETCPNCRRAVPFGTKVCPNCGYAVQLGKKIKMEEEKAAKAVKVKKSRKTAWNAGMLAILALFSFISVAVYPIMAIPVGLMAVVMFFATIN